MLYYTFTGRGRQNARRGAGIGFRVLTSIPARVPYRVHFWLMDANNERWAAIDPAGKYWVLTTLGVLKWG
jgi:hypothetical protein